MSEHWFISGANRGLGLEFTRQIVARGDRVSVGLRNVSAENALNAQLAPQHARVDANIFDSRDERGIASAAASVASPIDVLVANAGAFGPQQQSAGAMDYAAALDLFSINTLGPLRLAGAFAPKLKGAANPRIILMSSLLGSMAQVDPSTPIYSATKAALNKLGQCLAEELKPQGICVVMLHPGWVRTDMGGPNAPLAPPESVAGMIATIDGLTLRDSGAFLDYCGKTVSW